MRDWLVDDLDRFAIEEKLLSSREKRFRWPGAEGHPGLNAAGSAHAFQDIVLSIDLSANAGIGEIAGDIGSHVGEARFANGFVAARVVRMHVSVDHVLNRLVG